MKIAHISDVHFPLIRSKEWRQRWDKLASLVREQHPDLVMITGDVLTVTHPRGVATARLEEFVSDIARESLDRIPVWYVPGNHDVNFFSGLASRQSESARVFATTTDWVSGWREPLGPLHVFGVDSNYANWFARGKILSTDLDRAVISATCLDDPHHLHVFATHHHIVPEPLREGENPFTSDERTLGLNDSGTLLRRLAHHGFDMVLHGHRHLSTFHLYASPHADRRIGALWLVGAPSATQTGWEGFNIISIDRNGVFDVSAVRKSQGEWLDPEIVASRDYEEARTRTWRRQVTRPKQVTADGITVVITPYRQGNDEEQRSQATCGDIHVRVTIDAPQGLGDTLGFPLERVVGYRGVQLRNVTAEWVDAEGRRDELHTNESGGFDVSSVQDARQITTSAVLLNALPSRRGDWFRMRVSQSTPLADPIELRLAFPARFLRIQVDVDNLKHLRPVARERGGSAALPDEKNFYAASNDGSDSCHQELMVFRPLAGIGYALTASGTDPVIDEHTPAPDISTRVDAIQQSVIQLETAPPTTQQAIQHALDSMRDKIIEIAQALRTQRAAKPGDDISTDLLSVPMRDQTLPAMTGLRVVMTDSRTEARTAADPQLRSPVGIVFPWGVGVIGRALRLGQWVSWNRSPHSGHRRTWPAKEWYYDVEAAGPHAHIYCGPVYAGEETQYAVAMLSIASNEQNSLLANLIAAVRDPADQRVARAVEQVIADFAAQLGAELAPAL
jgi:3',5'-cyclic AMP phosphodiesterase CpdA